MPISRDTYEDGTTQDAPQVRIAKYLADNKNDAFTLTEIDTALRPHGKEQLAPLVTLLELKEMVIKNLIESKVISTAKGSETYYRAKLK